MSVIAFMNQKGGVGKTTSCINLAVQAARSGKTLMVDIDSQANLTEQFLEEEPEQHTEAMLLGKAIDPVKVGKKLYLAPASDELAGIEIQLTALMSRERKLKKALDKMKHDFDHVFIDCPPNASLVTVNALSAADYVILPIKADHFSIKGIEKMIDLITAIKDELNPDLYVLGVLITQYDERLKISRNIVNTMEENGWGEDVFKTMIRKNTAIENSQDARMNIFDYDRKSHAAQDYAKLGGEVMKRIKQHKQHI